MITNIKKIILAFLASLSLLMAIPAVANAQTPAPAPSTPGQCPDKQSISFFPAWYDNGLCKNGQIVPPNAFDTNDSAKSFSMWITILALNIVSMLLVAVGYVSLGFIIFGGFKYITSGDSSSGTAAARKTITNAVIGLVISIMSVAIVRFIAGAVGG